MGPTLAPAPPRSSWAETLAHRNVEARSAYSVPLLPLFERASPHPASAEPRATGDPFTLIPAGASSLSAAMLDLATWATILGTWILVVGTLAFAYWQLRQAQRLHSASTLLELRERFYSPRFRQARRELSRWLLKTDRGEEIENWEVGHFFELMGFLTHTRVLEKGMVWNAFGVWITSYYAYIIEPVNLLDAWRKESRDPLIYAEFEWLARQMAEIDRRRLHEPGRASASLTEARWALESESRLDLVGGPGPDDS